VTAPIVDRYRLLVPAGWWAIDLDPAVRDEQVAALVEQQWRGVDNAPHLKAEARAELGRQAAEAAQAGGLQLFLSVGALAGVPLSASLLVSSVPLGSPAELTALAERNRTAGRDVGQVELPAGTALRTAWREPSPRLSRTDDGAQLPATTCLDLHLPVPDAPRVLLLQFRTPMEPLADVLVELFDAIAETLRWTRPGAGQDGTSATIMSTGTGVDLSTGLSTDRSTVDERTP
jgi:hypothetical protein